jgi:general secretion pathway protein G
MTGRSLISLCGEEGGQGMHHTGFLNALLIRRHSWRCVRAFTLVELMFTVAIVATVAAIGVPTYNGYIDKARNATAMVDIQDMSLRIARFRAERGTLPATLAAAGIATPLDPWGNAYQYVVIEGLSKHDRDAKCRWNKFEKPLNDDFDLYSIGKDGKTKPKITHKNSHDDIIRANGGRYVGLASEY